MAIKIDGTVVIDDDRNANVGILTGTALNVNPVPITFSPADGASGVSNSDNIVITYNKSITKGSGNITLRDGSATGTVLETIAVSSGSVTLSAAQVTINPSSNFPVGKDIYVVIDEGAFDLDSSSLSGSSVLLDTYNFSTSPIAVSSLSPSDGATGVALDSNIVITFDANIAKGSGNITLRVGSASGTIKETIDVTSGSVSVSGTQATINPSSDFSYEEEIYVVVDAGCFTNSDGDSISQNSLINTYNFTARSSWPTLGAQGEGGYLICMASNTLWIVAPSSTEVRRHWYNRNDAITTANANAACGDWFIPSCAQLLNPGCVCRSNWDSYRNMGYWSNTQYNSTSAWMVNFGFICYDDVFPTNAYVRAFRCASY